ncbi:MAG: GNAT family N-acetyltransferase [Ruminiclostridium sp.]|nr:GNAT family N-acetyltransferase [Ruminiclostridium sp.]
MNLVIKDFTCDHIKAAAQLAKQNYKEERDFVPVLPPTLIMPDLAQFADNNMGVAAFENSVMVGFLCSYSPINKPFQLENVMGAYSPICGNAAIGENRADIYAKMYQAAAEKWVQAGTYNHAITLYAHDTTAQRQFFEYGFGLWGIDAIRPMEEITTPPCHGIAFVELQPQAFTNTLALQNALVKHFRQSPMFIRFSLHTEETLYKEAVELPFRYFAAKENGKIIAYLRVLMDGAIHGRQNICGAYCLPEYRGKGVYQNLLNGVISTLKSEGYKQLGVDFESFNPTARGFWLKYFTAYTCDVVRRIDDQAIEAGL